MALKQRFKTEPTFSMASMTIVVPNSNKVLLPKSQQQAQAKPLTRITIDKNLNYYVANGNETERQVPFEAITPFLQAAYAVNPDVYVALYADENVPYREIVKILDIANKHKFKVVLMTRPN